MTRRSPEEKREIIHLVEHSEMSVCHTLKELDVPHSTFYRWYSDYLEEGEDGLSDKRPRPRQFWNHIPDTVRQQVVDLALEHPDRSSRQIAWLFTDQEGYFISESSVYRILKRYDLIESPAFEVITAADTFKHPTKQVNELWQTDFTYFKIIGWVGITCLPYWTTIHATSWHTNSPQACQPWMYRIRFRSPWTRPAWIAFWLSTVHVYCLITAPATCPKISKCFWIESILSTHTVRHITR
jgi:transposase-like protein